MKINNKEGKMSNYKSRSFSLDDAEYIRFMALCKGEAVNASAKVRQLLTKEADRMAAKEED